MNLCIVQWTRFLAGSGARRLDSKEGKPRVCSIESLINALIPCTVQAGFASIVIVSSVI